MPWEGGLILTPQRLQAFVDWAPTLGGLNLLLWKYTKPAAYSEFIERILELELQLANGIEGLEERHRTRARSRGREVR